MWLTLLARFWYVFVIAALLASTGWYRNKAEMTQLRFDAFVAEVTSEGEKAKVRKIEKESEDAKKIADAVSARDAALRRMRDAQASARGSSVSLTPAPTAGSSEICFEPAAFASAVDRFRGRVQGIVIQGEEAQIDAQSLIAGWPKP